MPKFTSSLATALLAAAILPVAAHAAVDPTKDSAATSHAVNASAYVPDTNAPLGSPANPIPQSSPTPANLAYTILPSDPNLITNGPIPDTAANRAKYGEPLSHAGRMSRPAGD